MTDDGVMVDDGLSDDHHGGVMMDYGVMMTIDDGVMVDAKMIHYYNHYNYFIIYFLLLLISLLLLCQPREPINNTTNLHTHFNDH